MSGFENFNQRDPFADVDDESGLADQEKVHIRIQQRNGRKTLTTVQGLAKDIDPNRILKKVKKEFACNGNIVQDEALGDVIQLQGDQRQKVQNFLITNLGLKKDLIQVHGF